MSWRAKNLSDIAELFRQNQSFAENRAKKASLVRERNEFTVEARTWRQAADILNSTTLEETLK